MIGLKCCRFSLLILLISVACNADPAVAVFRATANPKIELETVDREIRLAYSHQLDVLSPANFRKATQARDDARKYLVAGRDWNFLLHQIALSHAFLEQADSSGKIAGHMIRSAVDARHGAILADAKKYFPVELDFIDKSLLK